MGNKLYNEDSVQNIANAIRAVNGSSTTYKIGEMANAISSISTGLDWGELGYDTSGPYKGLPIEIKNAFEYGKYIKDNYTPPISIDQTYENDLRLYYFPDIDITGYYSYVRMFSGSHLQHCPPLTLGIDGATPTVITTAMFRYSLVEDVEINVVEGNTLSLSYTFDSCASLKHFKTTSKITEMSGTFVSCSNLTNVELGDTSEVLSFRYIFQNCISLVNAPSINTESSEYFNEMFNGCTSLVTVPVYDLSSALGTESMFLRCTALVNAPNFDLSHVQSTAFMFNGCTSLANIPVYDFGSITNFYGMYNDCTSLTDTSLDNILQSCIAATNYTGTKTLAYMGINSAYDSRIVNLPHYNDFISAGWVIR